MSRSKLAQLNPSFPVRLNDVPSDVRLAELPQTQHSIVSAGENPVLPDVGRGPGVLVVSDHLDPVLMRLLNCVVDYLALVVVDHDPTVIHQQLILDDVSVHIKERDDPHTSAVLDSVPIPVKFENTL